VESAGVQVECNAAIGTSRTPASLRRETNETFTDHNLIPRKKPFRFYNLTPPRGGPDPFPVLYLQMEGQTHAAHPRTRLPDTTRRQSRQRRQVHRAPYPPKGWPAPRKMPANTASLPPPSPSSASKTSRRSATTAAPSRSSQGSKPCGPNYRTNPSSTPNPNQRKPLTPLKTNPFHL